MLAMPVKIKTIFMAEPLTSTKDEHVRLAVMRMIVRLRNAGCPVHVVHSDRGRQLVSQALRSWLTEQTIAFSDTGGEDPQANGRAELGVQHMKSHIRRLLKQTGFDKKWWPALLRHVAERDWRQAMAAFGTPQQHLIPCGATVQVRPRSWQGSGPWKDKAIQGRVLARAPFTSNAYAILLPDDTVITSSTVIAIPTQLQLVPQVSEASGLRRRVRSKASPVAAPAAPAVSRCQAECLSLTRGEYRDINRDEVEIEVNQLDRKKKSVSFADEDEKMSSRSPRLQALCVRDENARVVPGLPHPELAASQPLRYLLQIEPIRILSFLDPQGEETMGLREASPGFRLSVAAAWFQMRPPEVWQELAQRGDEEATSSSDCATPPESLSEASSSVPLAVPESGVETRTGDRHFQELVENWDSDTNSSEDSEYLRVHAFHAWDPEYRSEVVRQRVGAWRRYGLRQGLLVDIEGLSYTENASVQMMVGYFRFERPRSTRSSTPSPPAIRTLSVQSPAASADVSQQPVSVQSQAASADVSQQPVSVQSQAASADVSQQPVSVQSQAASADVSQQPVSVQSPAASADVSQQPVSVQSPAASADVSQQPVSVQSPAASADVSQQPVFVQSCLCNPQLHLPKSLLLLGLDTLQGVLREPCRWRRGKRAWLVMNGR